MNNQNEYFPKQTNKNVSLHTEKAGGERDEAKRHGLVLWLYTAQCEQHGSHLRGGVNENRHREYDNVEWENIALKRT